MSTRKLGLDEEKRRNEDVQALARLCEYVSREADRLGLPEAKSLSLSVARNLHRVLERGELH